MKKLYRIRKNEEFARIIAEKHSISSANFVLYFSLKKEDNCRVGISVSKKLGDAVDRNKIKRQVREMAKSVIDFNKNSLDYIIIVRKPFLSKTFQNNLLDLEKIVKNAIIE